MWRPLDHNEAERGDKSLPVRDAVTADDFLARLQGVARERHPDFSLVVVDFADDAGWPAKGYALDRVALRLSTARTDRTGLLNDLPVYFNLALHDVSRFVHRRLEVVTHVLELHAAQTDGVIVLEPERD